MGHIPGGLTLTLSLAWTGQALRAECDLKEDTAGLRHFDATYKCALPFIFNPSFPLWTRNNLNEPFFGRQAHRYLGYDCHSPHDDIGCCRYDACYFTLDNEDTIRTNLLQIHIKPLDHVRECTDSFITALAKYTGHFINPDPPPTRTLKYPVSNPGVLPHPTDPAVRLWKTAFDHRRTGSMRQNRQPRRHTFPQTAFVTYSLFGIETDQLEHCDQYYVDIYRLLFSQGDKHIDERTATRFLNAHHWSSTDFFETWFQPGAMVVISTPSHPEFFENSNCECLATKLDRQCQPKPCDPAYERSTAHNVREEIGQASVMPSQSRSKARCTDKYDDYNRIAEYPPLRYGGPLVAIYCILYEEIIRDTYERLVELQKSKLRSLRGTVIELHRLTRRLARIDNFEHLKLPITREFGQSILQTKRQENIRQGIDDLKSLGQTTVVIMLSFAGVLIALIALAPNLSAIVSFLENIK